MIDLTKKIKVNLDENDYQKIIKDKVALSIEELKALIDCFDNEDQNLRLK